ncbi:MAG: methyltransferase domain-containing protein [Elusimicrobia bacterium]|nr:methyltransferase domain-containing protein [Elusimicrobiota bacterium]
MGTRPDRMLWTCRRCGCVRIRRTDDGPADLYEHFYRSHEARRLAGAFDPLWRWLRERRADPIALAARPGARVLDVGCERGTLLHRLQRQGCIVQGTQLSSAAAEYARSRFGIDVFVGELDAAPYADGSFDVILMLNVIEHLPDPDRYVGVAARLLRRGGLIWIEAPNVRSPTARVAGVTWLHHDPEHHLWGFHLDALERLLSRHGLAIERVRGMSWEFGPIGTIQALLDRLPGPTGVLFGLVRNGPSASRIGLQGVHAAVAALLLPVGLLVALGEALLGQGQVVLVQARRA